MRNAGNKKLRLVLLALALLSLSMVALGGTFADPNRLDRGETTATPFDSNPNELKYNVAINYSDTKDGTQLNLLTGKPYAGTFWCPGFTKIIYITVANNEPFPVECFLDLKVTENGFDDMMTYAVINPTNTAEYSNWQEFLKAADVNGTLQQSDNSYSIFKDEYLKHHENAVYAVGIHMSEEATNKYQNEQLVLNFDFRVEAMNAPATPHP